MAGKRAGLAGDRSGLFMEQIRIIKEMRCADAARGRTGANIRPRWMVWENVPGAFSSNKGEDFGAVLQETIKIAEPQVPAVSVPKNGWPTAGCLTDVGGKWSVAWRVFDAQFWGVPQRRKRIALVADFGDLTAPEILFERKGVPGYCPQSGAPWQRAAAPTQDCAAQPGRTTFCIQGNSIDRADTAGCNGKGWTEGVSYTLNTIDRPAVFWNPPADMNARERHAVIYNEESITSKTNASNPQIDEPCHTLGATGAGRTLAIELYPQNAYGIGNGQLNEARNMVLEKAQTLNTMHDAQAIMLNALIRRLTPLECERLQGFPDGWTDIGAWVGKNGKSHTESADSARYKALGNSIALPPWAYVLTRLSLCIGCGHPTMASLFDGIGGFPLIWEWLNGKGSCLWASEIEDFPIAVTKCHFPDKGGYQK